MRMAKTGTKNAPIIVRKSVYWSSRASHVDPMIEIAPRMSAVGRNFSFVLLCAPTTELTIP